MPHLKIWFPSQCWLYQQKSYQGDINDGTGCDEINPRYLRFRVKPNPDLIKGYLIFDAPDQRIWNFLNRILPRIGNIVEKHPQVFSQDKITTLNIFRSAKSFCTGVSIPASGTEAQREAKFAGKHAPHLLFILDEQTAAGGGTTSVSM